MTIVVYLGDVDKTFMTGISPVNSVRAKAVATEMANGNIDEFHIFSTYSAEQIVNAAAPTLRASVVRGLQANGIHINGGVFQYSPELDGINYGRHYNEVVALENELLALDEDSSNALKSLFGGEIKKLNNVALEDPFLGFYNQAKASHGENLVVKALLEKLLNLVNTTKARNGQNVTVQLDGTEINVDIAGQGGKKHMFLQVLNDLKKRYPDEDVVVICADDKPEVHNVINDLNAPGGIMATHFPRIRLASSRANCDVEMTAADTKAETQRLRQEVRNAIKTNFPNATDKITSGVASTVAEDNAALAAIKKLDDKMQYGFLDWSQNPAQDKTLDVLKTVKSALEILNQKGGSAGVEGVLQSLKALDDLYKDHKKFFDKKKVPVSDVEAIQSTLSKALLANLMDNPECARVSKEKRESATAKVEPYLPQRAAVRGLNGV